MKAHAILVKKLDKKSRYLLTSLELRAYNKGMNRARKAEYDRVNNHWLGQIEKIKENTISEAKSEARATFIEEWYEKGYMEGWEVGWDKAKETIDKSYVEEYNKGVKAGEASCRTDKELQLQIETLQRACKDKDQIIRELEGLKSQVQSLRALNEHLLEEAKKEKVIA